MDSERSLGQPVKMKYLGEPMPWTFIFRVLWDSYRPASPSVALNIPDTILFHNRKFMPTYWIETSPNGRIVRRDFNLELPLKTTQKKKCLLKILIVREALMKKYGHKPSPWFCYVYYWDGKNETLDVRNFDLLIYDYDWIKTVSAIQAYIEPQRTVRGIFNAPGAPDRDDPRPVLERNTALDQLTEKLGKHIEHFYFTSPKKDNLKIYRIVSEFVLDTNGRLFFTGATEIRVRNESQGFVSNAEVSEASMKVIQKFIALFDAASQRGMSFADQFAHFDKHNVGMVSRERFLDGLELIAGEEIATPVQNFIMKRIGINKMGYVDVDLFETFVKNRGEKEVAKHLRSRLSSGPVKSDSTAATDAEPIQSFDDQLNSLGLLENTDGDIVSRDIRALAREESADRRRYNDSKKHRRGARKKNIRNRNSKQSANQLLIQDALPGKQRALKELESGVLQLGAYDSKRGRGRRSVLKHKANRAIRPEDMILEETERMKDHEDFESQKKDEDKPQHDPNDADGNIYFVNEATALSYKFIVESKKQDIRKTAAAKRDADWVAMMKSMKDRNVFNRQGRLRIVILPGLFHSIETLREWVAPVSNLYPDATILVLNLPGQPFTQWPRGQDLNNVFLGNCVADLLLHLETDENGWGLYNARGLSTYVLGFGNGGNIAAYMLPFFEDGEKLSCLNVSALVLTNAFSHIDTKLKRSLSRLVKMPRVATQHERVLHLVTLLFSAEYLRNKANLKAVLEEFFSSRQLWTKTHELDEGVSELIKGALLHEDVRPRMEESKITVVLVTGSDDALVLPKHSESFMVAHRRRATTIASALRIQAATSVFLDGGHELLQERKGALRKILFDILENGSQNDDLLAGDENKANDKRKSTRSKSKRKARQVGTAGTRKTQDASDIDDSNEEWVYDSNDDEIKNEEDIDEVDIRAKHELEKLEAENTMRAEQIRQNAAAKAIQSGAEREAWKQNLAEEREARLREVEMLRDKAEARFEQEQQREENRQMVEEEKATRYFLKINSKIKAYTAINVPGSSKEILETRVLRKGQIEREEKNEKGLDAATSREDRRLANIRRKKEVASKQYALQDIDLAGDKLGYGFEGTAYDPDLTLKGAVRLRGDVDLVRKRKARAKEEQNPILEEKMRYQDVKDKLNINHITITRAIKLARGDIQKAEVKGQVENVVRLRDEIASLKVKQKDCETDMATVSAKLRLVEQEVEKVNGVVQQVIIVQKRLRRNLEKMSKKMSADYNQITLNQVLVRNERTELMERRFEVTKTRNADRKRLKMLKQERERTKKWRAKYVDTTVWQSGVAQRIKTSDLKRFLKEQIKEIGTRLEVEEKEVNDLNERELELDRQTTYNNKMRGEFQLEAKNLLVSRKKAGIKVEEDLGCDNEEDNLHQLEQDALLQDQMHQLELADKMAKTNETSKERLKQSMENGSSLANSVRALPGDRRSTEERYFIAIDMLLHPELYINALPEDREIYRLDDAYKANVSQQAARRIATLPNTLNIAIAHMYTEEEVNAYMLIQKYLFGRPEELLDAGDRELDLAGEKEKSARIELAQYCRKTDRENLTKEEESWLLIDVVLRPHLYIDTLEQDWLKTPALKVTPEDTKRIINILRLPLGAIKAQTDCGTEVSDRELWKLVNKFSPIGDMEGEVPLPRGPTIVANSLGDVPAAVVRAPVLCDAGFRRTLLNKKNLMLEMRERRSYFFTVPDPAECLAADVRVTIVFRGVFDVRGYILGRISASLFFKGEDGSSIPVGVCHRKYACVCTAQRAGRIMIIHKPMKLPLMTGQYEVSVLALSRSNFSITVSSQVVSGVRQAAEEMSMKSGVMPKISQCKSQVKLLRETIRLGRRKAKVTNFLLDSAKSECKQVEEEMASLQAELDDEDIRDLMLESEAKAKEKRISACQLVFIEQAHRIGHRKTELDAIKAGLLRAKEMEQSHLSELFRLERELEEMRSIIPPAIAAECGIELPSTEMQGRATDHSVIKALPVPDWCKTLLGQTYRYWFTPAMRVKAKMPERWDADEILWRRLDYILYPEKNQVLTDKVRMAVADLPPYTQEQLELILSCPIDDLLPIDVKCRRLLQRIHYRLPDAKIGHMLKMQQMGKFWRKKAEAQQKADEHKESFGKDLGPALSAIDIDRRCRDLLRELDRATHCQKDFMDSATLHGSWQRFHRETLFKELSRDLDEVLANQIKEAEQYAKAYAKSEVKRIAAEKSRNENMDASDPYNEEPPEEKQEDEELQLEKKVETLADKRRKRAQEQVMREMKELGLPPGACTACRTAICQWKPYLDEDYWENRRGEVEHELEVVRLSEEEYVVSVVPSSVRRGGTDRHYREHLLRELHAELSRVNMQLRLLRVDSELHVAFCAKTAKFESKALHGYAQMLSRDNAIKALLIEQHRLVGQTVALELVDYILDWMLEGWFFGERSSGLAVAGYVPSIQKKPLSGFKAFDFKERPEGRKRVISEDLVLLGGKLQDRWGPIARSGDSRRVEEKALRIGSDARHIVDDTERTIKFGLFVLTLMFFRSIKLVRREKESWADQDRAINRRKVMMTSERAKIIEEEKKRQIRLGRIDAYNIKAEVGAARKKIRETSEKDNARKFLRDKVLRAAEEQDSAIILQAGYRGFVARQFAKRWARALAEEQAQKAIENAAAVMVQSCWRRFVARVIVGERRGEMLEYLEDMKLKEQKELEEEYWRVHEYQRMKRDLKKKLLGGEKKEAEFEITPDMIPRWYKGDYNPPSSGDEDEDGGEY